MKTSKFSCTSLYMSSCWAVITPDASQIRERGCEMIENKITEKQIERGRDLPLKNNNNKNRTRISIIICFCILSFWSSSNDKFNNLTCHCSTCCQKAGTPPAYWHVCVCMCLCVQAYSSSSGGGGADGGIYPIIPHHYTWGVDLVSMDQRIVHGSQSWWSSRRKVPSH